MHAWLCENPIGVEALQWKELPTPEPKAGEVRIAIQRREPELSRPADRAEQVPDEAAAALRAGLRIRGRGRGGRRRRHAPEGRATRSPAFGGTGGFGTHTIVDAALCMPLPPGFAFVDAAAFIMTYGTSHHALRRPRRS